MTIATIDREVFDRDLSPTNHERKILVLVALGYSNKMIAGELNIAERTVKNHMTTIMTKTGGRDRTSSVIIALDRGWIEQTKEEVVAVVPSVNLSKRQVECLKLLSLGMTYKEIAQELDITHSTVKSHFIQVCNKLDVSRGPHAVGEGIRRGLIE